MRLWLNDSSTKNDGKLRVASYVCGFGRNAKYEKRCDFKEESSIKTFTF